VQDLGTPQEFLHVDHDGLLKTLLMIP